MTKESSQLTTNSSQDAAELRERLKEAEQGWVQSLETSDKLAQELIIERQQRIESNALLLATALALGLDVGDVNDLPQKAATILAEGSAACQEWSEKYGALQWDYDQAEAQANQTTENALAANLRWKEQTEALETAIEVGRKFWQEYATLADDLPDDMREYFRQCSYLAGRFADALRKLEVNHNDKDR